MNMEGREEQGSARTPFADPGFFKVSGCDSDVPREFEEAHVSYACHMTPRLKEVVGGQSLTD